MTLVYPNQDTYPRVVKSMKMKAEWCSYIFHYLWGDYFSHVAGDALVSGVGEWETGWRNSSTACWHGAQNPAFACLQSHWLHGYPWIILTEVRFSCFTCEGNKMAALSLSCPLADMNVKMGVRQPAGWADVQCLGNLISGGWKEIKTASFSLHVIF